MRNLLPIVLLLVTSTISGCSESDSPTSALPASRAVNGTFGGSLPVQPPGEDWSSVTMQLMTQGKVSGVLKPKAGVDHAIGGTYAGTNLLLQIGDLPGDGKCYEISMNIFRFEFNVASEITAFEGTLSGHCQGTVTGFVRMERQ